jgi:hypothetical protein
MDGEQGRKWLPKTGWASSNMAKFALSCVFDHLFIIFGVVDPLFVNFGVAINNERVQNSRLVYCS